MKTNMGSHISAIGKQDHNFKLKNSISFKKQLSPNNIQELFGIQFTLSPKLNVFSLISPGDQPRQHI